MIDLAFLQELAHAAGDVVVREFRFGGVKRTFKDDGSANFTPVTLADKEVNRLVIDRVRQKIIDPGLSADFSIEGEEESDLRKGARFRLVCDPIDGTFPFAAGIPVSTFMVALLDRGVPVLAVIYDPFGKQMYCAEKGKGSTLNGARIHVSSRFDFSAETIIGSVWWNTAPFNIGLLMGLLPTLKNASVINLLSIGYMGAKVASGELAATVFPGQYAHDTAAVHLLVEEAGGVVTDLCGDPLRYDGPLKGHLAANKVLHGKLLELVNGMNPRRP
jgi:fructose-1,6-bisphosphatase/inositol monophosphatase family enzyme